MALTDTQIRRSKPADAPYKLSDAHGLYLLVKPNGGRLWRWKYRVEGKEKLMALGTYPELSLADARERHAKARKQLANGIDPMAERMTEKAAVMVATEHTFEKVGDLWLEHWRGNKCTRHSETTKNRLKGNVYPILGGRPIAEIEPMELVQLAKDIEARGASDMAKRILQIVGMVFRYAVAHGYSKRNPAAEIRPSDILKPTRKTNMARIDAKELPALLRAIELYDGQHLHRAIRPEDFLAYVYGILAQPSFTLRFSKELETRQLRVPITKESALFEQVRAVGARLLWLHTYGERFVPKGKHHGTIPPGKAKCTIAIPGDVDHYPQSFSYSDTMHTLTVGGGRISPVTSEVYEFEVSGLKVVQSWLNYRMRDGAGRAGSPLNEIRPERWTSQFTTELLELLWILEATVEIYPEQARLLEDVINGNIFQANELPPVPPEMRKPPRTRDEENGQLEFEEM